jgi:hypothetical protein
MYYIVEKVGDSAGTITIVFESTDDREKIDREIRKGGYDHYDITDGRITYSIFHRKKALTNSR